MTTKLQELISAETEPDDDAEPDEPDDETEAAEGDAETEPDEPSALVAAGIDEDRLRSESQRHTRAMQKILGDLFPQAASCVYCDGSGVTPESLERQPDMVEDPGTERCSVCAGLGLVRTGSLRESQRERSCTNCAGNGYITRAINIAPPPQSPAPIVGWPSATAAPLPASIPAGTLDVLRANGYVVVEPPQG